MFLLFLLEIDGRMRKEPVIPLVIKLLQLQNHHTGYWQRRKKIHKRKGGPIVVCLGLLVGPLNIGCLPLGRDEVQKRKVFLAVCPLQLARLFTPEPVPG